MEAEFNNQLKICYLTNFNIIADSKHQSYSSWEYNKVAIYAQSIKTEIARKLHHATGRVLKSQFYTQVCPAQTLPHHGLCFKTTVLHTARRQLSVFNTHCLLSHTLLEL